ncbi:MAG TPA: GNAT family N-acetyltransferase [Micromonosporaceae bacterium]
MGRRDYAGPDDLRAMQRAVQRGWTPYRRWHVGDLAWGRNAVADQEASWHTALWTGDDGDVCGWGWAEEGRHLNLHVEPDHGNVAHDVLDWFDGLALGVPASVTVLATEHHLTSALAHRSYRPLATGAFFEHLVLDLDDALPRPQVPDGYRLRAVRADEAQARAAAHRAAWRPGRVGALHVPPADFGDGQSRVTTASYQAVMSSWPYRTDTDWVVEAPDHTPVGDCGGLVAFALGWLDEVNQVGELEPVGTHPEHGRRGLAAAVSLACLRAMREAGATRAVVYPRGDAAYPVPRRLYYGLGFRPVARTVTFARTTTAGRDNGG